jgi:hypothetical protein
VSDVVQAIDPAMVAGSIEAIMNAQVLSCARMPGAVLHDGQKSTWLDSGLPFGYDDAVAR